MLLGERVKSRREAAFVGRGGVRERFGEMLADPHGPRVLHVYGPGGIGKTALLAALVRDAERAGRSVQLVDCEALDPFEAANVVSRHVAAAPDVLLLDSIDALGPLHRTLREQVALVPATCTVVFTSRRRSEWAFADGWDELVVSVELTNFDRHETAAFCTTHAIPPELQAAAWDASLGHPLTLAHLGDALANVGDARPGEVLRLEEFPSVLESLAARLVRERPSELHESALIVACLARRTTEETLARTLDASPDAVRVVFEWLAQLSCVTLDPLGVRPHAMTRRIVLADAAWRAASRLEALRRRVFDVALTRFEAGIGSRIDRLNDVLHLIAQNAWMADPALELDVRWIRPATPDDLPAIVAMTRRFEGDAAAEHLRHWFPQARTVVLDGEGEVRGFALGLDLATLSPADAARDPGVAVAYRRIYDELRLTRQRPAIYYRFWMGPAHHAPDPLRALCFYHIARVGMSTPDVLVVASPFADPAFWRSERNNTAFEVLGEFSLDGRDYVSQGAVMTDTNADAWFGEHFRRQLASPEPPPTSTPGPSLRESLRNALRSVRRPVALAKSPLADAARSLLSGDRGQALAELLRSTAESTFSAPADQQLRQVLEHTYFEPEVKQHAVAELLGISYATYRRRLDEALERLAIALQARGVTPS